MRARTMLLAVAIGLWSRGSEAQHPPGNSALDEVAKTHPILFPTPATDFFLGISLYGGWRKVDAAPAHIGSGTLQTVGARSGPEVQFPIGDAALRLEAYGQLEGGSNVPSAVSRGFAGSGTIGWTLTVPIVQRHKYNSRRWDLAANASGTFSGGEQVLLLGLLPNIDANPLVLDAYNAVARFTRNADERIFVGFHENSLLAGLSWVYAPNSAHTIHGSLQGARAVRTLDIRRVYESNTIQSYSVLLGVGYGLRFSELWRYVPLEAMVELQLGPAWTEVVPQSAKVSMRYTRKALAQSLYVNLFDDMRFGAAWIYRSADSIEPGLATSASLDVPRSSESGFMIFARYAPRAETQISFYDGRGSLP